MSVQINQTAKVVLNTLTWLVRVSAECQLQRILDAVCSRPPQVRSVVERLARAGLLGVAHASLAVIEVETPLAVWSPGKSGPNVQALAWKLERRSKKQQPRRMTVCWATPQGVDLLGGVSNYSSHISQIEHDLGTTSILAKFHEIYPEKAGQWVGEDILRRDYAHLPALKRKVPDAALFEGDMLVKAIEFGGQYSAERIIRFHRHCKRHRLPYELW